MKASSGSGQPCTGVNDGSTNTVLVTYLADVWNWGAEIFCQCEAPYVQKAEDGNGCIVCYGTELIEHLKKCLRQHPAQWRGRSLMRLSGLATKSRLLFTH
jgi:hypothetical protein